MPGGDDPSLLIAVKPRVHATPGGAAQPLDKFIGRLLASGTTGTILLLGPPGSGKSTALAHLCSTFPPESRLTLLDEPPISEELPRFRDRLAVVALRNYHEGNWLVRLQLAPWCEDDWIEYCALRHREACVWVLSRLRADDGKDLLEGNAQLWRIALDRLAADERLPDASAALREHLAALLPAGAMREEVAALCLKAARRDPPEALTRSLLPDDLPDYVQQLLYHRAVHVLLASEKMVQLLSEGFPLRTLGDKLPADLLRETATTLRRHPVAVKVLSGQLASRHVMNALSATLMLAVDPFWRPATARQWILNNARLARANWPGVNLERAELIGCDFHDADLSGALLNRCEGTQANFHRAKLAGASMYAFRAEQINLTSADLAGVNASRAVLRNATLTRANLRGAVMQDADFSDVNLAQARLIGTNLHSARLRRVNVEGADLIGVELRDALLEEVRLDLAANVSGLLCRGATLRRCSLEGMRLPRAEFEGANLTGSHLTGSFMPRGNFRGANLTHTGLAEIDWEGADLREADLRGCTFHMGSTRSGLVGSIIPCEGSKTGFYTDDFGDRDFKSPEEIRKANLCGADLRGANIEGVDFYLVDLRGARYSREQEEHLERCGAILHSRAV